MKRNKWFEIPKWCLECRRYISKNLHSPSRFLCTSCYEFLPFSGDLFCEKCGLDHKTIYCDTNWSKKIHQFHTIFTYEEPLDKWIGKFKYHQNFMEGRLLKGFVNQWVEDHQEIIQQIDLVLPVPIHWRGLHRRGFNQTNYLISDLPLSKIDNRILTKISHTRHQAGLSQREREHNLNGAFEINKKIEGKRILLFDDICTTGGTLKELCRLLDQHRVLGIDILVLCRTI